MLSDFVLHLPSNVQPSRFPSNSASNYSTQLDRAIELEGDWDVALSEVSYPKSVKILDGNEGITFARKLHTDMCSSKSVKTRRIQLGGNAERVCALLNNVKPKVFHVTYDNEEGFKFKVTKGFTVIHLDSKLQQLLGLANRDLVLGMYDGKKLEKEVPKRRFYLEIIDLLCLEREEVVIKKEGESVKTVSDLRKLFSTTLADTGLKIDVKNNFVHIKKESEIKKDELVIFIPSKLHSALGFKTLRCITHKGSFTADERLQMNRVGKSKETWSIIIYKNKVLNQFPSEKLDHWKVPTPRENTIQALLAALNENRIFYNYQFRYKNNLITLSIKSNDFEMVLDKELASVLGFERTHFTKGKMFRAEWSPSLYQNIDYVFIYSNICDHVNVGHMTAPLLHAVPFIKDGHGHLVHHDIYMPIYRPLNTSKLDRIDIRLCDGNGKDISFIDGKIFGVLKL